MIRTLTIGCRAFSGERIRAHRVLVTGHTVRVWDDVAGHYTVCHSPSPRTVRRIVRRASR